MFFGSPFNPAAHKPDSDRLRNFKLFDRFVSETIGFFKNKTIKELPPGALEDYVDILKLEKQYAATGDYSVVELMLPYIHGDMGRYIGFKIDMDE